MKVLRAFCFASAAAFVLVCGSPTARSADFTFGFEGCPSTIEGQTGEVKTFDVFVTLTTSNNPEMAGVFGWGLSLTADGGTIRSISVSGLEVMTIHDHDGDPQTPFVPDPEPYLLKGWFEYADIARHADNPSREGAVSGLALADVTPGDRQLLPEGTQRIARLTVEAVVPAEVTLRFEDGFEAIDNVPPNRIRNFTFFQGITSVPNLETCNVSLPRVAGFTLALEGCPPVLEGKPGEVKTFDVFVTLTTRNNPDFAGVQLWGFGITALGGTIRSISNDDVEVMTIYDHDDSPATPMVPDSDPFPLSSIRGFPFRFAQLAVHSTDPARKGAVSGASFSFQPWRQLLPEGTERIARVTIEAQVPSEVTLRFEDGFLLAHPGLPTVPLKNQITFMGRTAIPATETCNVSLRGVADIPLFRRGDANADGERDITDPVFNLGCLFLGERCPDCDDAADSNDDGTIDISDVVHTLGCLFLGGECPPVPFGECGRDPTEDELDCQGFEPCP